MDDQKKRYLMAKISTETYQLNPEYLSAMQRSEVEEKVQNMSMIQTLILSSGEAETIEPVRSGELDKAFKECIDNYPSKADFKHALASQHLTVDGLRQSLRDQLMCDRVLDEVVSDIPPLDIDKARLYYQKHRLEFSRSTTWEMSQILITINDEYEENTRVNALKRIGDIYEKVLSKSFEQYAVRYSECPSAMNNGYLGWCEEGKLYPQITDALYLLEPHQISHPIETEIGFHLVQYRQKKEAKVATFEEVWPFLQEKHKARARNYLQKQWINQLINQSKNRMMKDKIVCD
ncbi:peptidylprolyl isomerase [Vibrio salinus]|uniref:peptidylprolyl isomerase n=1 Tax=Vibrio salinus TaxID=2899784 RepID=UPI001E460D10|nr:peptidylprolyl isomerase [Vibrio salinus]MCE0495428.1 peptidylprolyl isomerase [Vibrio salinus]